MKGLELYAPRYPHHRRTWTLAAIVLALVFIIGGQLLGIIPALMTGFIGLDGETSRWDQLAYVLFATFGCGAVLVFLWIRFFERRPLATIGFNADGLKRFGRGYAIGLGFLLAAVGSSGRWAAIRSRQAERFRAQPSGRRWCRSSCCCWASSSRDRRRKSSFAAG